MLKNCEYNNARLLTDMSRLAWFLEKHAIKDAKIAKERRCETVYKAIQKDLDVHINTLGSMLKAKR